MSNPTPIKKQYIMTRKVTNVEQFIVDASSKAEAARLIEDECLDYDDIAHLHQTIPKFEEYLYTYQCPNIHNGWTDVASDIEVGSFNWHYNDMCHGEYTDEDAEICYKCAGALAKGYRALTQDELQYLSDTYGVVIA
jgi:hypothetical protein